MTTLLVPCLLVSFAMGCRSIDKTEPLGAEAMPTAPKAQDNPASDDPDLAIATVIAIDIDTKLAVMCGISDSKVFFKFDSATVRSGAEELLDKIATCAMSGPAKGKDLRVVGRTDPRGSKSYNMDLGKDRAEAVAKYLREQGVPAARTETVSKGEADGSADPSGWPYDRRVTNGGWLWSAARVSCSPCPRAHSAFPAFLLSP